MKNFYIIFLTIAFLLLNECFAKDKPDTITTKAGVLSVSNVEMNGVVKLNDKIIIKEDSLIDLISFFKLDKEDIALINIGAGSSCTGEFTLIVLRQDGSYKITDRFGNCTWPKAYRKGKQIIMDFPQYSHDSPAISVVYDKGKLSTISKKLQRPSADKVFWLYGEDIDNGSIILNIRDKFAELKTYQVTFIVINPEKREYKFTKNGRGGLDTNVRFPEDFKTFWKLGQYTWKCIVDGKSIAGGHFEYTTSKEIKY